MGSLFEGCLWHIRAAPVKAERLEPLHAGSVCGHLERDEHFFGGVAVEPFVGVVFCGGACGKYHAHGHAFQEVVGAIDDWAHDLVLPVAQTGGGVVPIYRELPNNRLGLPQQFFFGFEIEVTINPDFVKVVEHKIGIFSVDIH